MKLINYPSKDTWQEILKRPTLNTDNLFDTARTTIDRVRAECARAVLEYEAKFDNASFQSFAATIDEIDDAIDSVDE